jgi:hypothetical protein
MGRLVKSKWLAALCVLAFINRTGVSADFVRETETADDLLKTTAAKQVVWLTSKSAKFLSLYSETEKLPALTAAIILHDQDGNPDRPELISRLRRDLPKYGWSTLSLQLPLREQGASRQAYFALLPETRERIQTGISYLKERKADTIVLIGYGLGALAALYSAKDQPALLAGIIAISLSVSDTDSKTAQTLDLIKNLKIPLVDIYAEKDPLNITDTARDRRLAAKGQSGYRQIKIDFVDHTYQHDIDLVVKRIFGSLQKIAANRPQPENAKN